MRGRQWGGTIVVGRSSPIGSCGINDGNSNDNATNCHDWSKNNDVKSPNLQFWWQLDLRLEHLLRYLRALPTICVHPELDGRTLNIFHSLIFLRLPLSFLKLLNFEEKRSSSRERDLQGQVFFLFFSRKYVSNSSTHHWNLFFVKGVKGSRLKLEERKTVLCLQLGAVLVQWWEHWPSTNAARIRFPDRTLDVRWVCWFSSLLREVLSRVLWFSPLMKNQHLSWFDLLSPQLVEPLCSAKYTWDINKEINIINLKSQITWAQRRGLRQSIRSLGAKTRSHLKSRSRI